MSEAKHPFDELHFRNLVDFYCNGSLTDDEFAELEQCLLRNAAARERYRRSMSLESALRDFADRTADDWIATPLAVSRKAWRWRAIAAGIALLLVAAWVLYWPDGERPAADARSRNIVGVLRQLSGSVAVASSEGAVRTAQNGFELNSGDTIRTQDSLSAATVAYPDGTKVSLMGESSITLSGDVPKGITVHGGALFASVMPQPAEKPMRIATHTASLEVLGTQFTLATSTEETDVSVTEGRIRLTRSSDGNSMEVPAGRRIISNARSALVLEEAASPPDEWTEDFEGGLPDPWDAGKLVATGLPVESVAAVRAVRVPSGDGDVFEIATAHQWAHGLFAFHEDSHLHVTFKMRNPGWLNILILTRTADGGPPRFAGNYLFGEAGWWPERADQWSTVSIPLISFRPLPPARDRFENAVPFQILFSSPQDRGLVIDRISITRGGPGAVVMKEFSE
jgi:ferric-dicitrate binding protein FerR (iron transport regulator)